MWHNAGQEDRLALGLESLEAKSLRRGSSMQMGPIARCVSKQISIIRARRNSVART